jgi:hypothetical protein
MVIRDVLQSIGDTLNEIFLTNSGANCVQGTYLSDFA